MGSGQVAGQMFWMRQNEGMNRHQIKWLTVVLSFALLGYLLGSSLWSTYVDDGRSVNSILIFLRPGVGLAVAQEIAASVGGTVSSSVDELNMYALNVPTRTAYARDALIRRLSMDKRVQSVSPRDLSHITIAEIR